MKVLEDRIKTAGSASALARQAKVTPQYISAVRTGQRPMSAKLAKYLGLRVVERRYEEAK